MMAATIHFAAPQWAAPAIVVGLILVTLTVRSYRPTRWRDTPALLFALSLKLAAIALLLICLFEPVQSGTRPRPGANRWAVLIDTSRSMTVAERGLPAGNEVAAWLGEETSGWRARLAQDFDVRSFRFAEQTERLENLTQIEFQQDASNLRGALLALRQQTSGRPWAGVLLLTDGNLTDAEAAAALPAEVLPDCPIYPVLPQSRSSPRDLSWDHVQVSRSYFESSPVTVNADLVATHLSGQRAVVQLLAPDGSVVAEETRTLDRDRQRDSVRFTFRPVTPGVSFYQLQTFLEAERDGQRRPAAVRLEATGENNQATLLVDRGGGPFRVLYVGGRPNWEFKFLRRALSADDEVHLVGLLRIANKEPKFQFLERSTNESNRLFQGFENQQPDVDESYDQPVLVRLGVADNQELAEGFPATPESLFRYDAVILDDIEASFFSPDQMILLREYVNRRGGGLMMLGGVNSFGQGGYSKTPLGELLPVYLKAAERVDRNAAFRISLTREGLLETWTRLRPTESDEQSRLSAMASFRTLNPLIDIKPGAARLMDATLGDDSFPALVTQRSGSGRTAAMMVGDLWRWSLERPDSTADDLATFWRQTVRWLVSDTPRRVDVFVEPSTESSGQWRINGDVRTETFTVDDDARVEWTVTSPDGSTQILSADASPSVAGRSIGDFWPGEKGGYRVQTKVVTGENETLLPRATGFVHARSAREFQSLDVRRELLEDLAARTGGQCIEPSAIDAFVQSLSTRRVPVTETWVAPLWHQSWVFAVALSLLGAEWGIRRWKGLS